MSSDDNKYITTCRAVVRGWSKYRDEAFRVSQLKGALSNRILIVSLNEEPVDTDTPQKVVVRVFGTGTSGLIDRAIEKHIARTLPTSYKGLGPKVLSEFTDGSGRVEEFVPGHVLTWRDMTDPVVSANLAKLMAAFHYQQVLIEEAKSATSPRRTGEPILFPQLKSWLAQAKAASLTVDDKDKKTILSKLGLDKIDDEISWLQQHLGSLRSPVVFCHNDFQALNVLCYEDTKTDETSYTILDFEYAGYNFRGYDIANTMCECYINNHFPSFPHFQISTVHLPSQAQMQFFLRNYLAQYNALQVNGLKVTDEAVAQLEREVRSFMLASHLLWSLWGVVQVATSSIQDFGFAEYAQQRLSEYKRLKPSVSLTQTLSMPSDVESSVDSSLTNVIIPKKVRVHGFGEHSAEGEEEQDTIPAASFGTEPEAKQKPNRLGLNVATERRPSVAEEVPQVFSIAEKVPVHGFVEFDGNQQPIKPRRKPRAMTNGLLVNLDDLPDDDGDIVSVRRPVHGLEEELANASRTTAGGVNGVTMNGDHKQMSSPTSPPPSASNSRLRLSLEQDVVHREVPDILPAKKVPIHGFLHPAKTLAPLQMGPSVIPDTMPLVLARKVPVHGFGDGDNTPVEPGSGNPDSAAAAAAAGDGRLSISTTAESIPEEYPQFFKSPVHGFQLQTAPNINVPDGMSEEADVIVREPVHGFTEDNEDNELKVAEDDSSRRGSSSIDGGDEDGGDGNNKAEQSSSPKLSSKTPTSASDSKTKPTKLAKSKSKRKPKKTSGK